MAEMALNATPPENDWGKSTAPHLSRDRIREILLRCEFLRGLPETVERFLKVGGQPIEFSRGDDLISEDADDREVYFVLTGRISIMKNKPDGTRFEIHSYDAPQSVGEIAAQEPGQLRTASVVAATDRVIALKIPPQAYCDEIVSNAEFGMRANQRDRRVSARNIGARKPKLDEATSDKPAPIVVGCAAIATGAVLSAASLLVGFPNTWTAWIGIASALAMGGAMVLWTVQLACFLGMSKVLMFAVADRFFLNGKGGMSWLGDEVASFEITRASPQGAMIDGTDILLIIAFLVYAYFWRSERSEAKIS